MSVVVQVESGEGQRTVTIRSPLQVSNPRSMCLMLCSLLGNEKAAKQIVTRMTMPDPYIAEQKLE